MSLPFRFERETAIEIAEVLERNSMGKVAADLWLGVCAHNPYDRRAREKLGDLLFKEKQAGFAMGTIARSRFILRTMGLAFPTVALREAYLANLGQVLAARPKRERPGRVLLGIGAGRCGSTTLAAAFAALPDTCATHENPPTVFWEPVAEQLQLHMDRFRLLQASYALVFDAAHWWLNALERFFGEFPEGKVIGLFRDTNACVQSFLKVKGAGRGSLNHWAVAGNGIWATSPGDPLYPSYAVPSRLVSDPDAAKAALIERYVNEYNEKLKRAAETFRDRVLLVRTEDMNSSETAQRISDFVGVAVPMPKASLNIGGTADSDKPDLTY